MIDFTDCMVNKFKAYGGANGNWGILIDEQKQHAEIAPKKAQIEALKNLPLALAQTSKL